MSFSLDLAKFIEKAKGNTHQVVQKTAVYLVSAVIDRSPVGNPELWAVNKMAAEYNLEVVHYNQELRKDPENLTKAGRLKRGLKVNDSMDIIKKDGYVGGRFRGNWQVSFDLPATGEVDRVDGNGSETKRIGAAIIQTFHVGVGSIYLMNNVPYAQRLEYGWSGQAPQGVVRITVAEFDAFVRKAVEELPD